MVVAAKSKEAPPVLFIYSFYTLTFYLKRHTRYTANVKFFYFTCFYPPLLSLGMFCLSACSAVCTSLWLVYWSGLGANGGRHADDWCPDHPSVSGHTDWSSFHTKRAGCIRLCLSVLRQNFQSKGWQNNFQSNRLAKQKRNALMQSSFDRGKADSFETVEQSQTSQVRLLL